MKKKYLKYGLIAIISIVSFLLALGIFILIPLLIDSWAFGNDYPSNIKNEDWASFLGSYIGAILGGIVTLIGIGITILFQRGQANEDRRLSIAPYLIYNIVKSETYHHSDDDMLFFFDIDDDKCNYQIGCIIRIKNIGAGPSLNINVNNICFDNRKMHYIFDTKIKDNCEILEKNDACFVVIFLKFKLEKTLETHSILDNCINRKGILSFKVMYNDLMENTYIQDVEIDVNVNFDFDENTNKWKDSTLQEFTLNKKRQVKII